MPDLNNIKRFVFKRPDDNFFWPIASLFLLGSSLFITYKIFVTAKNNLDWIALFLPLIFFILSYLILKILFLRNCYYLVDKDKELHIDKSNKILTLKQGEQTYNISYDDIKNVEVYESWNTIPLFSQLGYIKFNLLNGDSFVITKFTATEFDLSSIIRLHTIKRIRRLMNAI